MLNTEALDTSPLNTYLSVLSGGSASVYLDGLNTYGLNDVALNSSIVISSGNTADTYYDGLNVFALNEVALNAPLIIAGISTPEGPQLTYSTSLVNIGYAIRKLTFQTSELSTLSVDATSSATTITLASTVGAVFDRLRAGISQILTLTDDSRIQYEVVLAFYISGNTITVQRGMYGTTALDWTA